MSLLDRFRSKTPDEGWRPGEGLYPSLFDVSAHVPALKGKGGVYALWHLGVRPEWLRIGAGPDLLACLAAAAGDLASSSFRGNGGIFAAWAFVAPARWPGVITHLEAKLDPVFRSTAAVGEGQAPALPAPVVFPLPPGTTGP